MCGQWEVGTENRMWNWESSGVCYEYVPRMHVQVQLGSLHTGPVHKKKLRSPEATVTQRGDTVSYAMYAA